MSSSISLIERARSAFPNLSITVDGEDVDRSMTIHHIDDCPLSLLEVPSTSVDALPIAPGDHGLDRRLKLIWQLDGSMRFQDEDRDLQLGSGDMLVAAAGSDYRLEMGNRHRALVMSFDPYASPDWPDLAARSLGKRVPPSTATNTAVAGASRLLSAPAGDPSAGMAAKAVVDLALRGATVDSASLAASSQLLARARLEITRHRADPVYGPERLARALGMSRRSLYARLAEAGTTPAALIRQVRLEHARQEVETRDGRPILSVALANGFTDGASFSRMFKAEFGEPPSALRRRALD